MFTKIVVHWKVLFNVNFTVLIKVTVEGDDIVLIWTWAQRFLLVVIPSGGKRSHLANCHFLALLVGVPPSKTKSHFTLTFLDEGWSCSLRKLSKWVSLGESVLHSFGVSRTRWLKVTVVSCLLSSSCAFFFVNQLNFSFIGHLPSVPVSSAGAGISRSSMWARGIGLLVQVRVCEALKPDT